jgi:hypothetical protein
MNILCIELLAYDDELMKKTAVSQTQILFLSCDTDTAVVTDNITYKNTLRVF